MLLISANGAQSFRSPVVLCLAFVWDLEPIPLAAHGNTCSWAAGSQIESSFRERFRVAKPDLFVDVQRILY